MGDKSPSYALSPNDFRSLWLGDESAVSEWGKLLKLRIHQFGKWGEVSKWRKLIRLGISQLGKWGKQNRFLH
jgi:hypothetical protein